MTTTWRAGRPRSTSRGEIERIALHMFDDRGFEHVTIDDIAAAAGISRRTFFRYFRSKNDVVWGDFDEGLRNFADSLAQSSAELSLLEAIRRAVVAFNEVDPLEQPWHRRRMRLILRVDALQAHSTLMYAAWRGVVAEYAAVRLEEPVRNMLPQLVGYAALAAAVTAYEQWLNEPYADLATLLDESLGELFAGFPTAAETASVAPTRRHPASGSES